MRSIKVMMITVVIAAALAGVNVRSAHTSMVDKVIVVVNDEVITQREFDRVFTPIKLNLEQNFKGEELSKRIEAVRRGVLDQLINSKLTISLAKKEKVEIDEEELQNRIDKIRGYYGSEEEFLQELSAKGTNLTEFEKELRDQMLAQELVEKEISSKIVVTPGEVKKLYDKNKEAFIAPRKIALRGIMLRKTAEGDNAEVRARLEEIAGDASGGEDFAELAGRYSEGPYAEKGGDMGLVVKGQLLEEIDEVVFDLDKGQISDVIESPIGYHIFKVEDIQESHPLEFGEVNDFLRSQLFSKKFQDELIEWIQDKRDDAYISYK